jgi:phosphoglucomutase
VKTLSNQRFYRWRDDKNLDTDLKKELNKMSEADIQDAFGANLEFGTAGMRGLLGVGPNRMNIYTIRKATVGFAKFILDVAKNSNKKGVAIAYDNRFMSKEFAYETAKVLAKYDIKSYVYPSLRSTPQLSFTVRHLHCLGGVMITASHNPKEYNGYKVYDQTGRQLIPDEVSHVVGYIQDIEDELDINVELSNAQKKLIQLVDKEVDAAYKNRVLDIQLRPEMGKDILTVFSAQHGAGFPTVFDVLNTAEYDVLLVSEQCNPDPAFSNTLTPNPEEKEAYVASIALAKENDADIAISTDPDADRVGVVVKHNEDYQLLSGNQTGSILLEYLFSTLIDKEMMPKNPVMFNTIVTSDLGEKVATYHGVETEKTLTGFKFIGEKIEQYDQSKEKNFVFGYEESYGYLVETFVRDKDAIQASLLIVEAAQYYKHKNMTFVDVLEMLYQRHGVYLEEQTSITLKGIEGNQKINEIMQRFRSEPMHSIANTKVEVLEDYLKKERIKDNTKTPLEGFDQANVLKMLLEDGSWIAIRPSGTEPKCKFYYCIKGNNSEEVVKKFKEFDAAIQQEIKKV